MDGLSSFEQAVKAFVPVVLCVIFTLLSLAPWPSPIISAILDPIPLVLLCVFVINRPDAFPMYASFGLGLLRDILTGQFLGVATVSYLLADYILRSQRVFFLNQPFFYTWFVYAIVLALANGLQWGLSCLFAQSMLDPMPSLLRVAFGVLMFPVLSGLVQRLQPARSY
jgi:rod shape-determining protein MreD